MCPYLSFCLVIAALVTTSLGHRRRPPHQKTWRNSRSSQEGPRTLAPGADDRHRQPRPGGASGQVAVVVVRIEEYQQLRQVMQEQQVNEEFDAAPGQVSGPS